jgi:uncharacterized protein YndB with AHSA1/START domain
MMTVTGESEEVMFEGALEAAPEKVWRALTIPEYLSAWLLPASNDNEGDGLELDGEAAGLAPIRCEVIEAQVPNLLRYRWSEDGQPDAVVTFRLQRMGDGNTWLRLSQGAILPGAVTLLAANSNASLRRAA